ncbi:FCD domain-containing protein [Rhodococcoides fascians]|uniref:FCD domain-containing protein n=2 Tax=Nocardiaceae TaxID=85025 RepID=UPI001427EA5A
MSTQREFVASSSEEVESDVPNDSRPGSGIDERMPEAAVAKTGGSTKLADRVATRIEAEVMAKKWPVGANLGSESDLIAQHGVSRAVLREGIRIVESHNVARMRRGPSGGLIVTEPNIESVLASAALYLDFASVRQQDLFAVRTALEFTCLRQLSENLDEAKIARLREAIADEGRVMKTEGVGAHNSDLHVLLAELSGNSALRLFVDVLVRLTQQRAKQNIPNDPETAGVLHHTHSRIVEALIDGDLAVAQHRLAKHLEAMSAYYR